MKKTTAKAWVGPVCVLLAAFLWGTIGLYVRRLSAAGLGTLEITLTRMSIGLAAMAVYLVLFCPKRLKIRLRDLWLFAGAGIVSMLCMNICYTETLRATSLAIAGTLLYTAPSFVMLLSLLFFHERMTLPKVVSLVLAFAGCALVSGIAGGQLSATPRALALGLGAGLSYASYSIFGRAALERGYDSWTITFYSFAFCTLSCLLFASPGKIISLAAAQPALLVPMALLGLTTGFAAFLLYTKGLSRMEAGTASILASFELVAGAAVGMLAFHEHIGLGGAVGIVLLLCAVAALRFQNKT